MINDNVSPLATSTLILTFSLIGTVDQYLPLHGHQSRQCNCNHLKVLGPIRPKQPDPNLRSWTAWSHDVLPWCGIQKDNLSQTYAGVTKQNNVLPFAYSGDHSERF